METSHLEKCTECGFEIPSDANFCPSCGSAVRLRKETFSVDSDGLIQKVKDILRDADVKRIIIRNSEGETLLTMPVTWGAAGALATVALAPWLAALGVVAALATRVTIEVQRAKQLESHLAE